MKIIPENKIYPLIPLRDIVIFPYMVVPLFIGREKSVQSLDIAMKDDRLVVFAPQRDPQILNPSVKDLNSIGTVGEILQMLKMPNGSLKVLIEGLKRCYINKVDESDLFEATIKLYDQPVQDSDEAASLRADLLSIFERLINLNSRIPREALTTTYAIEDISRLSDIITSHVNLRLEHKQLLINVGDPIERTKLLIELINGSIEILDIERHIQTQVRKQMEKTQKDYFLNEQMKVIKKELNNGNETLDDLDELKLSIEEANLAVDAKDKALKEIKKLEKMPPLSAESTVVRNYIEWLRDIPWHNHTEDNEDIDHAKVVLDEDHYGLEEVKERILEFMAVRQLSKTTKGPIICFAGPPGVGKTSLGKSVARALGRKFIRISLGGVRDEAEIRGHRRTYVGSLPGKIIQAMKKAGTINPVILLDEIDKMSTDFRGDPSSALLEVLDPEQNNSFVDHYIEMPYDLSGVLFITTANVQHQIPLPLLDRMEIIEINSYTEAEKLEIAKRYLLAKQLESSGLKIENAVFPDDSFRHIIRHYTKESGVRNLDRAIGKICRKIAREIVSVESIHSVTVDEAAIIKFLGPIKFKYGQMELTNEIGLANGLAWTAFGGDVMQIEASLIKGKGLLMLTGKLGEVMQESAQAAFTFVKSNMANYNFEEEIIKDYDLHLHVPEGAIPKDGPSAGITMAVVMASVLGKIPIRCDFAMTGEITLRGKVLPIGGLKEKVLAAHRAGIKHIIIPIENKKDLEQIPDYVRNELSIYPVTMMEEVLFLALETPENFFKKKVEYNITAAQPVLISSEVIQSQL